MFSKNNTEKKKKKKKKTEREHATIHTLPLTFPLAKAMAIIAAASMTHESGFHINPRNFSILLS